MALPSSARTIPGLGPWFRLGWQGASVPRRPAVAIARAFGPAPVDAADHIVRGDHSAPHPSVPLGWPALADLGAVAPSLAATPGPADSLCRAAPAPRPGPPAEHVRQWFRPHGPRQRPRVG